MTDSFVTQCPHCQTSFRVSHNQLSVARGVVRCGACMQVFNAAKQLLEQSAAQKTAVESAAAEPVPLEAAPEVQPTAVSPREWSAAELDLDQLDLDQELARLEQREIQPTTEFKAGTPREDNLSAHRDEPDSDDQHWPDSLFSTPADERGSLAEPPDKPQPPLVEQAPLDLSPAPGERTEPSFSLDADILDDDLDEEPKRPHTLAPEIDEVPAGRLSAKEPEDDLDLPLADPDERHEPELGPLTGRPSRKEPLLDLVDDPLQLDWQKPRTHRGKRLMRILLVLLAAAALAGQYIWYHFDELAR
ncbi:MAG: MJ0042-type zinc finger domain-containing protein, partial [Pseudomonas sp.]